jgi:hypothetical protein
MGHESNNVENYGSKQPNSSQDDFRRQGLSQDEARRAAEAAQRARQGK